MIHPTADVHETVILGEDCHVWAGAAVMSGTRIGAHCSIGRGSEIGHDCDIGEGTRIGYGVFIPNHTRIGRGVFLGPRVTLCDDKVPRANNPRYVRDPAVILDDVSVGAGAVILPGVVLGQGCLVGAGAVVTHYVHPWTTVAGNPARRIERARPHADEGIYAVDNQVIAS